MRNRIIAAVVIVAMVAGGGWWWWSNRAKKAAAKNQSRTVMARVQKGDINSTITGTGSVASVNGVTVKSNQSGTAVQILAQDGDRVKAGQVIMVLDNPNLQASLQQARLDLTNSRTSLDNLLHPLGTAVQAQQLKVESARLTLKQRQEDVAGLTVTAPQQGVIASVGTTEGSNITANALLFTIFDDSEPTFVVNLSQQTAAQVKVGEKATVDLNGIGRIEGTVVQSGGSATPASGNRDATVPVYVVLPPTPGVRAGMVGQATFNSAGLNYVLQGNGSVKSVVTEVRAKVAATVDQLAVKEGDRVTAGQMLAQLSSESVQLALKQAENDLKTQEQNLVNLIDPAQDPSGQARTLQQKIDQATISLANAQTNVDELQVKAPVDGVISSLTPRVGDKITNNQSLFRVADYNALQVTISVDELDIAKVKVGQGATVTLDALSGKTFKGKVSKINPEGVVKNDIATFEVTIAIENPQGVMAGMNAQVNVTVENKPGVLWLPAQAVTVRQGKAYVRIEDANKQVQQKEIQIGVRTSTQVEITGGLNEGDQVVLTQVTATNATQQGGFPGLGGGNIRQFQGGQGGTPTAPAGQGNQNRTGTSGTSGGQSSGGGNR